MEVSFRKMYLSSFNFSNFDCFGNSAKIISSTRNLPPVVPFPFPVRISLPKIPQTTPGKNFSFGKGQAKICPRPGVDGLFKQVGQGLRKILRRFL
jgi:hypothetical protein